MSHARPIVFVVDDDVSVRTSLELLIDAAGWQPVTLRRAEFLHRPRFAAPLPAATFPPRPNVLELQIVCFGPQ